MQHKILVIDDQWSMQQLARLLLQPAGFRVLLAEDGQTGLNLARTEHPDAIIMDMPLPGIDAMQVLRELDDDIDTACIPVILVIQETATDMVSAGLQSHATKLLLKPFPPLALVEVVQSTLRQQALPLAV